MVGFNPLSIGAEIVISANFATSAQNAVNFVWT